MFRPCDLCGSADAAPILLECERLDGPLVRCGGCGLVYVGARRGDFTFVGTDEAKSAALAGRVRELGLVDESVESAEAPWREKLAEDRLRSLRRHVPGGRLLEIGCAAGDFLKAATLAGFEAVGVESEPITSARARTVFGLDVITGTLDEAAFQSERFDVVALFHVVEHLDSPRKAVAEIHRVLRPGGVLVIETPNIDTVWFRLLRSRWRQFIPDHYFFFTPKTLTRLLRESGFRVVETLSAGKPMSVRLFLDRARRLCAPVGTFLGRLARLLRVEDRTLRLRLGDVMLVVARKTAT